MQEYRQNLVYRILLNTTVVDAIGTSLFNIVFIVYASTLPFRTLAVSLASLATVIPALLQVVSGYWADHTRRRVPALVRTYWSQAALFGALAGLITLPGSLPLFVMLLLVNIVSDVLGNYSGGVALPIIKHAVPGAALYGALSFNTAALTTVQLVFQALGASAIVVLNHNYVAFGIINAASFVVCGLLITRGRTLIQPVADQAAASKIALDDGAPALHQSFLQSARTTLRYLAGQRFILVVVVLAVFVNMLGSSLDSMLNVSLLSQHGLWLGNFGTTVAAVNIILGIFMVLGAVWANDGLQKVPLLVLLLFIMLALTGTAAAMVWGGSRLLVGATLAISGYLIAKINPRFSALVIAKIDERYLAQMSGFLGMMMMIGAPVGQIVFLTIMNAVSVTLSWTLYGSFALMLAIIVLGCSLIVKEPE